MRMTWICWLAFGWTWAWAQPPQPCPPQARGGVHFLQTHDLNQDGQVTRDEFVNSAQERFDAWDGDSDGVLSEEELAFRRGVSRHAKRGFRHGCGSMHAGRGAAGFLLRSADSDQNAVVTREEWQAMVDQLPHREDESVDLSALNQEQGAFRSARTARGAGCLVRYLDTDQNGKITDSELIERFAAWDEDGDGAIQRGMRGR